MDGHDAQTNTTLTAVAGLAVGPWTDREAATGCTVVLCAGDGAVAGVDVRGSAPGTRETDLLDPVKSVERIHAVLLTGGSAFGLDAATGIVRWLEERDLGCEVGACKVPLVCGAVLFDLPLGRGDVRPDAAAGYAACEAASPAAVAQGCVGAGTGAAVGKLFGWARATKGGLGSAAARLQSGVTVAALAAVNAFGDVVDPASGTVAAGARRPEGGFVGTTDWLRAHDAEVYAGGRAVRGTGARELGAPGLGAPALGMPGLGGPGASTTLVVVATDADLDKVGATRLARTAQDGLARSVDPCHTALDGDTVFALATGTAGRGVEVTALGAVAARVVAEAVLEGVRAAVSLGGVPAVCDLTRASDV